MDLEKQGNLSSDLSDTHKQIDVGSVTTAPDNWEYQQKPQSRGFFRDVIDGFKRADLSGIDTGNMTDAEIHEYLTSKAPLKRSLNTLQIGLIAIGGSIGSGLFIGSGSSFTTGGPAGVVIGFGVMGVMIFATLHAIGELAVRFPQNGSFLAHVSRFVDPSFSLAMGWNYLLQWLVTFPLELISASITLGYWDSDNNGATRVSKAAWVSLFYAFCIVLNLFGAKGYGWGEAVLSIIKVCAVLGFAIFGIVVSCGGYSGTYAEHVTQPDYTHGLVGKYIGGHFWHHPGAFASGAKGVFSVLVNAAFSFAGSELAGLAAAETANPSRALPKATKQVFWRVVLFYIVSLTLVGCLVPYTDNRLGSTDDGRASPFVIAISNANVKALPSIFNTVICLAVLSVGNACVYAASRTMASLAAQGYAPRIFAYIDREGRPLMGIALVAVIGLLCFLAASDKHTVIFNWLLALSGLSSVVTWGAINLAHIRFRMGLHRQGRSTDELTFKAGAGVYGSIVGLGINVAVIGLQFWIALFPVGGSPNASDFFQAYLSIPIIIVFYIFAKFVYLRDYKTLFIRAKDMDLDSGAREVDREVLKQEIQEENERIRSRGFLYRTYNFWC
nr:Gap1.2 [Starmerella bombicola]